jgi:membrane protein
VSTAKRVVATVGAVAKRAKADRVPDASAAVTYWVVLSLAPMALAAAALLGTLDTVFGSGTADRIRDDIIDFLERTVGSADSTASLLETITDLLETPRRGIAIVSLLLELWGVRRAFAAFFRALGVVSRNPKLGMGLAGQGLAVAIGLATILVAALAALQFGAGPLFGFQPDQLSNAVEVLLDVWTWLRFPVLAALVVAWMGFVLSFGAAHSWKQSLPGATLTTALWLLGAIGFRFYVQLVGEANAALGVLGGVIIALTWLYLQTLAVLYGAELNAVLHEHRSLPTSVAARRQSASIQPPSPSAGATAAGTALVGAALVRLLRRR